ncbi:Os05g0228900 [Oryza sativa Japonica Group]|uniref:Os05g0228900 protein n=2 Tax=Oryza sativa subsp. japonica TaxID=39947 RepID=A0A0P0WJG7_ORYSJ|nr:hypothetical protein [Oryza sativa Japonica Group]KAB8098617.1 hypothetical protein EE612_027998 [Oryza sativa]KAF2929747.1 hypothetical protein DAI22_05g080300 [Oryza sativa Japonica Group]BAF16886.1 Os05g0228900 [Oryza sativa Japonica Group]BAS92908.1 Os05g0228900 [Oryza sativa Japonica Group]|eukprot:NP_001054972.1 Os05g0228900 [Oryza sativa Japonica Group]
MVPKREYSSNIRDNLIRENLADGAIPLRTRAVTLWLPFFFHRTPFLSPSLTGGGSTRARQASSGRAQAIVRASRRRERASMGEPTTGGREQGRDQASGRGTRAWASRRWEHACRGEPAAATAVSNQPRSAIGLQRQQHARSSFSNPPRIPTTTLDGDFVSDLYMFFQ